MPRLLVLQILSGIEPLCPLLLEKFEGCFEILGDLLQHANCLLAKRLFRSSPLLKDRGLKFVAVPAVAIARVCAGERWNLQSLSIFRQVSRQNLEVPLARR